MEREDVLIHVDNSRGSDNHDGTHQPVARADRAFSLLPAYWHGRAEIIFHNTGTPYLIETSAVCLGTPIGPEASPLVIRGEHDELVVEAMADSTGGDYVNVRENIPADQLVGLC
jgi:hypothetical protein